MKTFTVITGFKMENSHNQSIRGLSVLNIIWLHTAETFRIMFEPSSSLVFPYRNPLIQLMSCRFKSTAGYKYRLQLSNNSYLRKRVISFCTFHVNVFNRHICILSDIYRFLQAMLSKDKLYKVNYCSRLWAG